MRLYTDGRPWPILVAEFEDFEAVYSRLDNVVIYATPGVVFSIATARGGAFWRLLKRQGLLFLKAAGPAGELVIYRSKPMHDIRVVEVDGSYLVRQNAHLAHTEGLSFEAKWRGLFIGKIKYGEAVMTALRGRGLLAVTAYGTIFEQTLDAGDIIDNKALVAADADCKFKITTLGTASLLTGQWWYLRSEKKCSVLLSSWR